MPSSSAARSSSSSSSRTSTSRALLGEDVDVERERLHLLQQHLEGLGDRRLGDVLALDDRLVRLHAPDRVVGLDREHLLQRVRGAVGLERPHLHLAEALAAELRLAAQRLLGDERVRAGRARVDLVVDEVEQLEDVHVADGDLLLERLAGAAVEEPHLAGARAARRGRFVSTTNLIGESGFCFVHVDRARRRRPRPSRRRRRASRPASARRVDHARAPFIGSTSSPRTRRARPPSRGGSRGSGRCSSGSARRAGSGRCRPGGRPRGTACPPRGRSSR